MADFEDPDDPVTGFAVRSRWRRKKFPPSILYLWAILFGILTYEAWWGYTKQNEGGKGWTVNQERYMIAAVTLTIITLGLLLTAARRAKLIRRGEMERPAPRFFHLYRRSPRPEPPPERRRRFGRQHSTHHGDEDE